MKRSAAAVPDQSRRDSADLAAGRLARDRVPRTAHGDFRAPQRDPVAILEGTHVDRDPDLVPILVGRMLHSPFAFYRGSAALMAHDLAGDPTTGHQVVACGDAHAANAHAANFGFYASPERRLVFDLNDFDEAYPGPWEGDVKRLAASFWLNGRNGGQSEEQCRAATISAVRGYRTMMRSLYDRTAAQRYFFHVDEDLLTASIRGPAAKRSKRLLKATQRKARRRTSEQVLSRLTATTTDGGVRIIDQPPVVRHPEVKELERVERLYRRYLETVRPDVALLIGQYELVDYALRIVGVGSVGKRAWVLLLLGPGGDPMFLQAKEASPSVLQTHGGVTDVPDGVTRNLVTHGQGFRVVSAQRILQAMSDPFLGWVANAEHRDGSERDYYIRQYRDMKGGFALEDLDPDQTVAYARLCGGMLARAHSQTPGSRFVTGYLGRSDAFDEAVTRWAVRYADQAEADHAALGRAVASGRLSALTGA